MTTLSAEAQGWIDRLQLQPHPEGGYYAETFRAPETWAKPQLPQRYAGERRALATAIYFLLHRSAFSAFHRIASDELWLFHAGAPCRIYLLDKTAGVRHIDCGTGPGQHPQVLMPRSTWFAAEVLTEGSHDPDYTLVSCTVHPGFDFQDFELARAADLAAEFPDAAATIHRMCRQ